MYILYNESFTGQKWLVCVVGIKSQDTVIGKIVVRPTKQRSLRLLIVVFIGTGMMLAV